MVRYTISSRNGSVCCMFAKAKQSWYTLCPFLGVRKVCVYLRVCVCKCISACVCVYTGMINCFICRHLGTSGAVCKPINCPLAWATLLPSVSLGLQWGFFCFMDKRIIWAVSTNAHSHTCVSAPNNETRTQWAARHHFYVAALCDVNRCVKCVWSAGCSALCLHISVHLSHLVGLYFPRRSAHSIKAYYCVWLSGI